MSFLKMTVIGNLGRDAEIREVGNMRVISFTVAHSEKFRDRNTNLMVEKTTWISCSYWRDPDKTAVAQYLRKGTQVYIEGTPSVRTYVNQQGETVAALDCRVLTLQLLGSAAGSGGVQGGQSGGQVTSQQAQPTPAQSQPSYSSSGGPSEPDFVEDDLPF